MVDQASVDDVAELRKSLAERTKSSDPPTKPGAMRLAQVFETAMELAAHGARESKATIGAEDVLRECAAAKVRTNRPLTAELALVQPLPVSRSRTVGLSGVVMLTLAATVVGFLVMFPTLWQREATDGTADFAMSLQPVQSASVQPSVAPIPRLVVPVVTPLPEAVSAPQEQETAIQGSENPTARTEQHGGTTQQERVPSKATASTPSNKPIVTLILPRPRPTEVPERASPVSTGSAGNRSTAQQRRAGASAQRQPRGRVGATARDPSPDSR